MIIQPGTSTERLLTRQITDISIGVILFLLTGLFLLGFAEGFGYWQVPVLLSLALFIAGALIGFLFGIPKVATTPTSDSSTQTPRRLLDVNTNLEQISDWLTKIIVGLGLVELRQIPSAINRFTIFVGPGFHKAWSSPALATAVSIYFPVLGFISGYLITRLYLSSLIGRADIQLQTITSEVSGLILAQAAQGAADSKQPPAEANTQAVTRQVQRTITPESLQEFAGGSVLWVDDRPANNTYLIKAFERLGISVDLSLSTEDAVAKIDAGRRYDAIITDMGRVGDPQAGYTLLSALRERSSRIPVIVYAGSDSEQHRRQAIAAGAADSTNRPQRVFEFVTYCIRRDKKE